MLDRGLSWSSCRLVPYLRICLEEVAPVWLVEELEAVGYHSVRRIKCVCESTFFKCDFLRN